MSRYLTKITACVLTVAIFLMAGDFCFASLFDSMSGAASARTTDMDACGEPGSAMPEPMAGNQNGLMPCCVDGGHPNALTLSNFFELSELMPISHLITARLLPIELETAVYHAPNISPPELLALKKTVLRL